MVSPIKDLPKEKTKITFIGGRPPKFCLYIFGCVLSQHTAREGWFSVCHPLDSTAHMLRLWMCIITLHAILCCVHAVARKPREDVISSGTGATDSPVLPVQELGIRPWALWESNQCS